MKAKFLKIAEPVRGSNPWLPTGFYSEHSEELTVPPTSPAVKVDDHQNQQSTNN